MAPAKPEPAKSQLIDQAPWDNNDAILDFLKAIGVQGVIIRVPPRLADGETHTDDFIRMKKHVEDHGLELAVLHCGNLPKDEITIGSDAREKQASNWINIVRGIGEAGVPLTATTFQPIGHFRSAATVGRGGVKLSTFRLAELEEDPARSASRWTTEEQLWSNISWFYERLIPVAEEVGVRVCLHPDDPPISEPLGGAARITSSIENYHKIFDLVESPSNGMLFCQGCVHEMGVDVTGAIRSIGGRGKIGLVHFRNIVGTPENFQEVFIDEGDQDMLVAMQTYKEVGFRGPFMMDHTPRFAEPFDSWHGHAYANGYIKALLQIVYGK
jgi:mannonate dehydratase